MTCYLAYAPLGLDIEWWVHRWLDFQYRTVWFGLVVFLGRAEAEFSYREANDWHDPLDWDNTPIFGHHIPLIGIGKFRCYWWWPILGCLSAALFGLFMVT
jgi:hypothetical protein